MMMSSHQSQFRGGDSLSNTPVLRHYVINERGERVVAEVEVKEENTNYRNKKDVESKKKRTKRSEK